MSDKKLKITAVIAAAGSSVRMGFDKLSAKIGDKSVLARSVARISANKRISDIVVVVKEDFRFKAEEICKKECKKSFRIVSGGINRQESVSNGICACEKDTDYFVIHDGARPFVTDEEISAVIEDAIKYKAAVLAVPVKDTVKVSADDGFIQYTPDRSHLFAAQTPQVFEAKTYLDAMKICDGVYTDDCALVENAGTKVHITLGKYSNIKITTVEDLKPPEACMRIGHGYDVHRLESGRKLILGGVEIPYEKGLLGHSDADVLTHSVMDAILGALALGDIGKLFPDTDSSYKDIDSLLLLERVYELMHGEGYGVSNIDSTIVAQAPKLSGYIEEMRRNIADALNCPTDAVNIKATTEEKLGFTGRGEGISAHAVVLLCKEG